MRKNGASNSLQRPRASSKQFLADAEAAGRSLVQSRRAEAEAQAKAMLQQAEDTAAEQVRSILETSQAESAALREQARTRLLAASDYLIGKVVNR